MGKKKNIADQSSTNNSRNTDTQESSLLENMETEVQSPVKNTPEKDKNKIDSQKTNYITPGKMEPPKISVSKKGGTTPIKNSSSNIVQAPATSSTVGGPSLPHRSSIGSTNQDFSSFR